MRRGIEGVAILGMLCATACSGAPGDSSSGSSGSPEASTGASTGSASTTAGPTGGSSTGGSASTSSGGTSGAGASSTGAPGTTTGAGSASAGSTGSASTGAATTGGGSTSAGGSAGASSGSSSGGTGTGLALSPFFGMTTTTTSIYPQVTYGVQRFWDSPPFQWQTLQTAACADITACANGYDQTNMASFDTYLAQLLSNGVTEAIYTMARTPYFITSGQNDTSCNYSSVANGACDRPSDLNADGSGTNQTFRMWYAFFASRLNDPTYLKTHAHVRYWEIWNEPDTAAFWGDGSGGAGSYAALVRMTEDMRCMLTGNGVVHNYGANGPVPCAQAGLPATGIDPSALILMPSYHAEPASLTQMQNFLYCTSTSRNCNTGSAGAAAVDVINMHMKPGAVCTPNGAGTNCTAATSVEPAYAGYIANVQSYLQAAELAKPIWDDEASYAPSGFAAPYTDADMAASWIPRFLLVGWSLGVQSHDWYTWDKGLNAYPLAVTAWDTTASWIAGATLSAPCQAVGSSQVFSCTIDKGGTSYEILWDASQSCSGGSCTTNPYAVGAGFKTYADIAGNAPQNVGSCSGCKSDEVPLGVKPLLLAP